LRPFSVVLPASISWSVILSAAKDLLRQVERADAVDPSLRQDDGEIGRWSPVSIPAIGVGLETDAHLAQVSAPDLVRVR
jgi:hypothetical protein